MVCTHVAGSLFEEAEESFFLVLKAVKILAGKLGKCLVRRGKARKKLSEMNFRIISDENFFWSLS